MPHGWTRANGNELTDDACLDPLSGFPAYRGFYCGVEKVWIGKGERITNMLKGGMRWQRSKIFLLQSGG